MADRAVSGTADSCFFIAFAAIALLVAQQGEPTPIRNFATTSLTLMLLVLLSSLLHIGRFTPGLASMLWFGVLASGTAAFVALLRPWGRSNAAPTTAGMEWSATRARRAGGEHAELTLPNAAGTLTVN